MAEIYKDFQSLAEELLDKSEFGQSTDTHIINILRHSETPGGTDLDEPSVNYTAERVDAVSRGTSEKRDGADIVAKGELMVTIKAKGVTVPSLNDLIEINGTEYAIVDVETRPNFETPSVYRVLCRK